MTRSNRSKNSRARSATMADRYADFDSTGVSASSTRQSRGRVLAASYCPVQTGALALSVLPWPIPITSGLEHEEVQETLEEKFTRLADTWERETQFVSSLGDIVTHKAHLQIVAMGLDVIPLILNRMQEKPGLWFDALCFLTRDDPVTDDIRGDIRAMTDAWLVWGKRNGYC